MYHLLVTDDEPALVEGLCDYLASILPENVDILKAYSGLEACSIMSQFSIDILISDIQMPGMNGLELINKVEQLCPHCDVIFLTGYNTFSWIQEALRHSCCVDYILKTQGDSVIGEAVLKQLRRIEKINDGKEVLKRTIAQMEKFQPYYYQGELTDWLVEGKNVPAVTYGGIQTKEAMMVCLWHCKSQDESFNMYQSLMRKILKDEFADAVTEVVSVGWGDFTVLIQVKTPAYIDSVYYYLYMRLERMQGLLRNAGYVSNVAFIDKMVDSSDIRKYIKEMHEHLMEVENTEYEVIIRNGSISNEVRSSADEVIQWIKQYVKEHIADFNLSLVTIAEKSCYSAAYLSRLFKQKEHTNLLAYIAQVRINTACELLRQGNYNVQQVCRMVGFESTSYFVALFKRKTGKTPRQYMCEERWRREDEGSN